MERKTIIFTVDGDSISPRTEQKAGVQGSHNVTEVRFNVEEDLVSGVLQENPTHRIRIQIIDGAGGFYSTGFLDVMSEILSAETSQYFVTCPIPDDVTNAGGMAYVYLVVTEITYVDEVATENQVYISQGGKLVFTHSGVGSPSEYAYRVGISNALVNAEIFVGQAEKASESAKTNRDEAEQFAEAASGAKADAEELKNEVETKLANGDYKGEQGPQGEKGDKGDKGEKGDKGDTPELTNYIRVWQPNTKYKVGDVCYFEHIADEYTGYSAILECKTNHTSCPYNDPLPDIGYWTVNPIQAKLSERDTWGNVIHETYATKEEVGNIETALDNIIAIQNQLIGGDSE